MLRGTTVGGGGDKRFMYVAGECKAEILPSLEGETAL
jgi:hypothetical protein